MPSLVEQAQTIRGETVDGANTAERVGQFMEESARVTETVDTIADLRAFDTTNLTEGNQVYVKAHNTNGLNKGFGRGLFKWITTEVLTLNESASAGQNNNIATLALNESVAGDGRPNTTNKYYGDNLVFPNGVTATVNSDQAADAFPYRDDFRSYGKGFTSIFAYFSGSVPSGAKAYFADDNGVYIRPTFAGFSGEGYWKRVLPEEGSVTYTMYGAIPEKSFRNTNPFDSYQAMQDAEDSLFDVKATSGYYYTTQTVVHSRNKNVTFTGASVDTQISPYGHGRFFKYVESDIKAYIYTDTDIDIYRIEASGDIKINVECRGISTHTKRAVVVDGDERIKGKYDVKVNGEIDSFLNGTAGNTNGTRAFEIAMDEGKSLPQTFSNGGAFSFNTVRVAAIDCYSGITSTAYASGSSSFSNTNNFFLVGRRIVKPIEHKSTQTNSNIEGWYQCMDNVPNDGTIPAVYTNASRGCYVNFFIYDTSKTGAHEIFLDVDSNASNDLEVARMTLGPKSLTQIMQSMITSGSLPFFDLPTRLALERYDINQFNTLHKRIEVSVTANEILNSNTTPIDLLAGDPEISGIVVQKAWLKDMSGTSNYSTNTTMNLQANPDAGRYQHTAGQIDLTDLNINDSDAYYIPITPPTNNVNSSGSADSLLRLITSGGNPTGGDAVFTIVVEYIQF